MSEPIELTSAELDDNAVAKAMEAFVSSVRGQDPEWTDEYYEEIVLVSPYGEGFALEYPIRDAIKAYLSLARAGLEAGKAEESMLEKAAAYCENKANKHGWNYHLPSVGRELAQGIRALPLTGDKP